ncbi:MAG: N-acetylneuraminate synthase family protein [Candidatus Muiribacteriota bacterium]
MILNIGKYKVGKGQPPFVIAEIGVNHNGDIKLAEKHIIIAKKAGAHAVKFQTWTKNSLYSENFLEDKPDFKKDLENYSFSFEQFRKLKKICDENNILFSATPFSFEEVDFLASIKVPFIKIASMDLNNYPFLEYAASKKIPVFLSTGFSTLDEIVKAVDSIKKTGNHKIVLMHCISDYPPVYSELNLNNIKYLDQVFNLPVGFSDHSTDILPALYSAAIGACVVERHFTLDKNLPGWDHAISCDPEDMAKLCKELSKINLILGDFERKVSKEQKSKRNNFRRSMIADCDLKKGETLTLDKVRFARPATGISPEQSQFFIGMKLKKNLKKESIIKKTDFK